VNTTPRAPRVVDVSFCRRRRTAFVPALGWPALRVRGPDLLGGAGPAVFSGPGQPAGPGTKVPRSSRTPATGVRRPVIAAPRRNRATSDPVQRFLRSSPGRFPLAGRRFGRAAVTGGVVPATQVPKQVGCPAPWPMAENGDPGVRNGSRRPGPAIAPRRRTQQVLDTAPPPLVPAHEHTSTLGRRPRECQPPARICGTAGAPATDISDPRHLDGGATGAGRLCDGQKSAVLPADGRRAPVPPLTNNATACPPGNGQRAFPLRRRRGPRRASCRRLSRSMRPASFAESRTARNSRFPPPPGTSVPAAV